LIGIDQYAVPMSAKVSVWASIAASVLLVSIIGAPYDAAGAATASAHGPAITKSSASANLPIADGDCEKILDPTTVALSLTKKKSIVTHWGEPLLFSVGGIDCSYLIGPIDAYVGTVDLKIAPSAVADNAAVTRSLTTRECSTSYEGSPSTSGCRATATVNGWWYSLRVNGSAKTQKSAFDKITAGLTAVLSATKAPTSIDSIKPFDCTAVDTGGLAVTTRRIQPNVWAGVDDVASEIYAASYLVAGPTTCRFTLASGKSWQVTVYPGGEALFFRCGHFSTIDDYPGPSSVISIPGVPSTYGKVATNNGPLLCATDGTSLVRVSGDDDLILNSKARTSLGSILVPVLAAAD
jgi:hypothetical protein